MGPQYISDIQGNEPQLFVDVAQSDCLQLNNPKYNRDTAATAVNLPCGLLKGEAKEADIAIATPYQAQYELYTEGSIMSGHP